MSPEHLHILQHTLGVDQYGRSSHRPNSDDFHGCYRNRFITDPTCPDGQQCQQLVTLGYMSDYGPQRLAGGMHCYTVTDEGYDAMRAASPHPPKLTRSQRTYQAFREVGDLFSGPKRFEQFLKSPNFKQMVDSYGHA